MRSCFAFLCIFAIVQPEIKQWELCVAEKYKMRSRKNEENRVSREWDESERRTRAMQLLILRTAQGAARG